MKESTHIKTTLRKPFTKPSLKVIEMSPCTIVSLSDEAAAPPKPTGGGSPDVVVPGMGWGD